MRLNRWAMVHGRPDQPGYRFICSVHWTRTGAQAQADGALRAANQMGYAHLYWVERRMGDDKPGDAYLVTKPMPWL
jgi:hypothetical protein